MKFHNLKTKDNVILNGPLLLTPEVYEDERGFFYESWNKRAFNKILNFSIDFVQDNHSKSSKGVLRGLHYQIPDKSQGKLIKCSKGKIFDVMVDLRTKSKTFGEWSYGILSSKNKRQIWIPEGFAHGFLVMSDDAEVEYKTNEYWSKDHERCIIWNDNKVSIDWPLGEINMDKPILGKKDLFAPTLDEILSNGDVF